MKKITVNDLHTLRKSIGKNDLILDVRTPEEYAEGHVPGARNISHEQVASRIEELRSYQTIYVYCRSGGRVGHAAMDLTRAGFTNLVLVQGGGMPDWEAAGYPVEK